MPITKQPRIKSEREINGQKQIVVENADTLAPDDILQLRIDQQLKKQFKPNLTTSIVFDNAVDALPEGSLRTEAGIALKQAKEAADAINDDLEKVKADLTRTPGEKALMKDLIADRRLKPAVETLERVNKSAMSELETVSKELFAVKASESLNTIESAMLSVYAKPDAKLSRFGTGTQTEAKLGLFLAKHFPSSIQMDMSVDDYTQRINARFTPEAHKKAQAFADIFKTSEKMIQSLLDSRNAFVDKDLLAEIRSRKAE